MADKKSLSDLGAVLNPTPEPAPVETATEATEKTIAADAPVASRLTAKAR